MPKPLVLKLGTCASTKKCGRFSFVVGTTIYIGGSNNKQKNLIAASVSIHMTTEENEDEGVCYENEDVAPYDLCDRGAQVLDGGTGDRGDGGKGAVEESGEGCQDTAYP